MKKLGLCLLAVATLSAGAFAACSTNDATSVSGGDAGTTADASGNDGPSDGSVATKDGSAIPDAAVVTDASKADSGDEGPCGALCETGPLDASARCFDDGGPQNLVTIPENAIWASGVESFTSEYNPADESWNAIQVLGAPNAYPAHGDIGTAWATQDQDMADESIVVTFPAGTKGRAVWIFETYNPDAIAKVTVTATTGDLIVYTNANPTAINDTLQCSHVLKVPSMTNAEILKVRIDLASDKVPSWNEIDAIGVMP